MRASVDWLVPVRQSYLEQLVAVTELVTVFIKTEEDTRIEVGVMVLSDGGNCVKVECSLADGWAEV
jgi:hypothetical protein